MYNENDDNCPHKLVNFLVFKKNNNNKFTFKPFSHVVDFKLAYASPTSINTLEFTTDGPVKFTMFSDEDIQTFDMDWKRGLVIWANLTGHVKARLLREGRSEYIPTLTPGMWHYLDLLLVISLLKI